MINKLTSQTIIILNDIVPNSLPHIFGLVSYFDKFLVNASLAALFLSNTEWDRLESERRSYQFMKV